MKKIHTITTLAVFCALGALLPQAFHLFGAMSGQVFLPMHIPAMLAGFLMGPVSGLITGLVSPILSNLITGGSMPILIKVPLMMAEVGAYGLFCGVFSRKVFTGKRLSMPIAVFCSLLSAQILGRAVNILCTVGMVRIFGITHKAVSAAAAFASIGTGLPGIVIQWLFVPTAVLALKKILQRSRK